MESCPKCKRGQLFFEIYNSKYRTVYRCNNCMQLVIIKHTKEEIKQVEEKEKEDLEKRRAKYEEYVSWYRNQQIYARDFSYRMNWHTSIR